ncbi:hypothetical protein D3C86_1302970 [compost metagenome]
MREDALVRRQIADEAQPGRARHGQLGHALAGREEQAGAAPAALELLRAHLAEADGGVGHPDMARRDAVHHHVVVALPVHDERQLKALQRVARALHTARGEAERLARARQAVQRGAGGGHVGQLAQLAQRHRYAVVPADHRQAGGAAIHLLGLLHQCEAPDHALAELRLGMEIEQHRPLAPLGQLLLAVQLAVYRADAFLQHLAQPHVALQDQLDRLLGNHQQPRIGFGDGRGDLLLPHHTGPFAEDLALAERGEREGVAVLLAHDPHRALPHHVEAAVVAAVLLEDGLAGRHTLHAHAAHGVFEFALVQLAAQIEQPRDEAASRADRHVAGDEGQRGRVAANHRLRHAARNRDQLGLARRPHGGLVPVLAQQGDIGKDLAGLAHAHADFLAVLLVEHAHRAGPDDENTLGRVAGIADRVAEAEGQRARAGGQPFEFLAREWREDLHRGEEIG